MRNDARRRLTIAGAAQAQRTTETATPVQTVTQADIDKTGTEVGEVVVVGSRIRHDVYNTPSPVQLINRDETTIAGFATPTDTLQGNAVTAGAGQINNAFGGFVTQGGPGANTLGLKGLGATRTLILLNGRRLSPAGTRGATNAPDLNVLPNIVLDHIEILKDGASSIYGSDAVAGVVNVITRKNVDGVEFEGDYHYAAKDAGSSYRASLLGGKTAGPLNILASLDFYHRRPLTLADRDWTQCQQDLRGSLDYIDPSTGQSKCYTITTGSGGVTINTLGTALTPGVAAVNATGPSFNRWRPNASVFSGLIGYEGVGGGNTTNTNIRTTFDPRMLNRSLISPVSTLNLYSQATHDTNAWGNAQVYAEFLGSSRMSSQTDYRQLSLDYPVGSPLIPAQLAALPRFSAAAPPDITGGKGIQDRVFLGFGNTWHKQNLRYFKPTLGVRGDVPDLWLLKGWRYDFTYMYSVSNATYTDQTFLIDKLTNSLDVVAAPQGTDPALINTTGFTCRINTTSPSERCIPAPSLTPAVVSGQLPQSYRNYILQPRAGNTDYWERTFLANFDGPLFKLPDGEVKGAIGFETRRQRIDDTPSLDSQRGNYYNFTTAAITRGNDSVWEVYGEVEVPILADRPFAKNLTLNVSGRYTDYKTYGNDNTYKVTGLWRPFDWFSLRGTIGTSYRAPALFELYQGASTGFQTAQNDPCQGYSNANSDPVLAANCASEGLPQNFNATQGITIITAGNNTHTLHAEDSKNATWGFILQPRLPEPYGQVQLAVDYSDIRVNNEIAQIGGLNILQLCYFSPEFHNGSGYCALVTRNPNNTALTVLNGYVNIATQVVRGIDYNLRYTNNIGPGQFRLDALVTQFLEQSSKTFSFDDLTDFNKTLNTPEYTVTIEPQYKWGPWKVRYEFDWLSSMDSYPLFTSGGVPLTNRASDPQHRILAVPSYELHNIAVQYSSPKGDWQVTGGVRNLLDKEPPSISANATNGAILYNRVGNAPLYSGYDYIGRVVYLNFTKKLF